MKHASTLLVLCIFVPACTSTDAPSAAIEVEPEAEPELAPDEGEGDVPSGEHVDVGALPSATARPGDTIESSVVAAIVPAPGESVTTTAHFEDGTWRSLVVTNDATGHVTATTTTESDLDAAGSGGSTTAPKACSDGAFNLAGFVWAKPYEWSFRVGSTPSTSSKSNVEAALGEAVGNITHGRNDCGMASALSASSKYLGRTTRGTNIVSTATSYKCGTRDGHSVVGFGVLPRGIVGVACTWFATEALEGDVKLNDRFYVWYAKNAVPAGCARAFSVEAIATHEFGHVFGMNHVSEKLHGNLTMSTQARACSGAPSTLGRGDVLGLRKKYGL